MLPSIRHPLWALVVLAPVAACNAILGLGDPIDGGGPPPGAPDATVESSVGGDAAQTRDGTTADSGSSTPDSADATQNPMDAPSQTDTDVPPDSTTSSDTGTIPDAPANPDGDPCSGVPDSSCLCTTSQDCTEAGTCCCVWSNHFTTCADQNRCPVFYNGYCL